MKIVAFDLSLTATGVAWDDDEGGAGGTAVISTKFGGLNRLAVIRDRVLATAIGADLVLLEGYSFGQARGTSHMHAQGELGGVVRLALFEAGYRLVDVPPATLKKFATGKGNAKKEEVLAAAIRRLGYPGSNHNESDALWLVAIGFHLMGTPTVDLPKLHTEALAKIPAYAESTPCHP